MKPAANPRLDTRHRDRLLLTGRLITIIFIAATMKFIDNPPIQGGWFLPLPALLFLLTTTAASYLLIPRLSSQKPALALEMAGDLSAASAIVYFSGGLSSPFTVIFPVIIIFSSILAGLKGALLMACLSSLVWSAMAWEVPGSYLPFLLINIGVFSLTAMLSGLLVRHLAVAHQALGRSQSRLERLTRLNNSIIKTIDSGLITADANGLVLSANRTALELLNQTEEEILGHPWAEFWPQVETLLTDQVSMKRVLTPDSSLLRFEYIRRDGRKFQLEIQVLTLLDHAYEDWRRLFVVKDLTERIRMETEMRQAERLAALGAVSATLAHELRTPLAALSGSWQMLTTASLSSDDRDHLVHIIGREMERLSQLTKDFLSFARQPQRRPEFLDLNRLLEDQLRVFHPPEAARIHWRLNLSPIPPVYFDLAQFSQAIWNLLQNAAEAVSEQEHPEVTLETGLDPEDRDMVLLSIRDNGHGLDAELAKKIFDPFFTTKTRGIGLGLAIVSRIIYSGQGRIAVDSTPEQGAVFSLHLPQSPREIR